MGGRLTHAPPPAWAADGFAGAGAGHGSLQAGPWLDGELALCAPQKAMVSALVSQTAWGWAQARTCRSPRPL